VKTIGDCYVASAGVVSPMPDHAEALCSFGCGMLMALRELNRLCKTRYAVLSDGSEWKDLQSRVGVHSGDVLGGIIGSTKFQFDLFGETVEKAEIMESYGEASRVNVSHDCYLLARGSSALVFERADRVGVDGQKLESVNPEVLTRRQRARTASRALAPPEVAQGSAVRSGVVTRARVPTAFKRKMDAAVAAKKKKAAEDEGKGEDGGDGGEDDDEYGDDEDDDEEEEVGIVSLEENVSSSEHRVLEMDLGLGGGSTTGIRSHASAPVSTKLYRVKTGSASPRVSTIPQGGDTGGSTGDTRDTARGSVEGGRKQSMGLRRRTTTGLTRMGTKITLVVEGDPWDDEEVGNEGVEGEVATVLEEGEEAEGGQAEQMYHIKAECYFNPNIGLFWSTSEQGDGGNSAPTRSHRYTHAGRSSSLGYADEPIYASNANGGSCMEDTDALSPLSQPSRRNPLQLDPLAGDDQKRPRRSTASLALGRTMTATYQGKGDLVSMLDGERGRGSSTVGSSVNTTASL
jgi:hypothetical protein